MSQSETDLGRNLDEQARRYTDFDDRDPRTIERRIDATRADLRVTLEALERRLSFDRLIELTVGRVRERGGEFAGNLTDAATQNPIPMLLTSIGLGWMMLTNRSGGASRASYSTSDLADKASGVADKVHGAADRVHGAAEKMHGAMDSARERLGHTAESLRGTASHAASATREQVDYARQRMDRLLEEQPLMLGAIGLAAGAIVGAWLPTTEHENRMLGEVRDKAVRRMAQEGRSRLETASEHAQTLSTPGREDEAAREQSAQRPH